MVNRLALVCLIQVLWFIIPSCTPIVPALMQPFTLKYPAIDIVHSQVNEGQPNWLIDEHEKIVSVTPESEVNTQKHDTVSALRQLGGYPCPESKFTCVKILVPLDPFNSSDKRKIPVVFAVLPAIGERKGMFVTADGGPGGSGLADADQFAEDYGNAIRDHFDIVFFDQRGVGVSQGLACETAAKTYYQYDLDAKTSQGEKRMMENARAFVENCVNEMGKTDLLPYMGTIQAVEDLEVFRRMMNEEKFWLYGLSYGTQFAQTYAFIHPDRLAALVLDGTVDLTISGIDYFKQQAKAFNDVLVMTLEACNADPDCAKDSGGDAIKAYDSLAARLSKSPIKINFPLPSGKTVLRDITLVDLESVAANYLYSESDRMVLQRALAAAARDDFVPLERLSYITFSLDPQTLKVIPDKSFSDAAFYAVECNDYAYFSGTSDERAKDYLLAGDTVDASQQRLNAIFYGDFPCPYWTPLVRPQLSRPPYLRAEGIPTLVLDATADPATPYQNGMNVFQHLADGYLVTVKGGPHVVFGWGNDCPDTIVTDFLVKGKAPKDRQTVCAGTIADTYVKLAPKNASSFANPLKAMQSVEQEINYLPEYLVWDGEEDLKVGCPYGGKISFVPDNAETRFRLDDCAFTSGFSMNGTGRADMENDSFTLNVRVGGIAAGKLIYSRDSENNARVHGNYNNKNVDIFSKNQ